MFNIHKAFRPVVRYVLSDSALGVPGVGCQRKCGPFQIESSEPCTDKQLLFPLFPRC